MVGMWSTVLIGLIVGFQPICNRNQFEAACKKVLTSENKTIANAIYEAYLDQVGSIGEQDPLGAEKIAIVYLFDLSQSLSVLGDEGLWKEASKALVRSTLLQSRNVANPWQSTVWVDLSLIKGIEVSLETNGAITDFLQEHYIQDLEERHKAFEAISSANYELCEQLTSNAMRRWHEYQKIIEPYMSHPKVKYSAYPKLNTGQQVINKMNKLNVQYDNTLVQRFNQWSSWHKSQTNAMIALISTARSKYLFDPWSPRCGASTNKKAIKIQEELLQLSATVRDKNLEAIDELNKIAHKTQ